MLKKLIGFILAFIVIQCQATTSYTSINNNFYTSIPENAGSGFAITAFTPAQCVFSASQPTLSTPGHRLSQGDTLAINSTGLALWCKSEAAGANFIVATIAADASINSSGSSGGGGSGGDVNLTEVGGTTFTLGQKTKSGSLPITLASDQGNLPVIVGSALPSGSNNIGTVNAIQQGTWNINNVSGTISLPTGASTSANQTTANTSLSNIDTNTSDILTNQTNGLQKAQIVDNTNTNFGTSSNPFSVNVLSGGGSSTDIVATGTLGALNDTVTTAELNGASTLSIEYDGNTGSAVGNVTIQVSTDGTVWREVGILQGIDGTMPYSPGIGDFDAAQNLHLLTSVTGAKFARAIMDTYTSGTASVTLRASSGTSPFNTGQMNFSFFMKADLDSIANNVGGPLALDSTLSTASGRIQSILNYFNSGLSSIPKANQSQGVQYTHISTNTTTTINSGGTFYKLVIGKAGTTSTATLMDGANTVAVIDTTVPRDVDMTIYGIPLGVTQLITAGGTAADITVFYCSGC